MQERGAFFCAALILAVFSSEIIVCRTEDGPTKYCSSKVLEGITFVALCERDGQTVECDDRIRPGTIAKISCQPGYRKPSATRVEIIVCDTSGEWDYPPFRCDEVCGEELTQPTPFILRGEPIAATKLPWHVGIYKRHNSSYNNYICGGTIVSAKVIVSAAHCFWDSANKSKLNKDLFLVGAGKHYHDFAATENSAQFQNISILDIPDKFLDSTELFNGDIAVLVLVNFLKFNEYVAPVCLDLQAGVGNSIPSNELGQIASWRVGNPNDSAELKTTDILTSSYNDCLDKFGPMLPSIITEDKFCGVNATYENLCLGGSGGGLTVKKASASGKLHYLWGVLSGAIPVNHECEAIQFITLTNVHYYNSFVMARIISNRPK